MAINTAERRKAVRSVGRRAFMGPGVTPNVAKDAEWRSEVAGRYPGIPATNVVARRRIIVVSG